MQKLSERGFNFQLNVKHEIDLKCLALSKYKNDEMKLKSENQAIIKIF